MTTPRTAERVFALAAPAWRPPPGDGLVVALAADTAGWPGRRLGAEEGAGVVAWAATTGPPAPDGILVARQSGVRAVTLAPAGADAARVALALRFAAHLRAVRTSPPDAAYLTSPDRPVPPDGALRLPHLVAVSDGPTLGDSVVWELMTRQGAYRWLGGPLPDQAFAEAHLAGLLALRAAARAGTLPATAAGRQLARLLRDRYLSIRLVYQHPDLFRTLLARSTEGPA